VAIARLPPLVCRGPGWSHVSQVFPTTKFLIFYCAMQCQILKCAGSCAESHAEAPCSTLILFRFWTDKMTENYTHKLRRNYVNVQRRPETLRALASAKWLMTLSKLICRKMSCSMLISVRSFRPSCVIVRSLPFCCNSMSQTSCTLYQAIENKTVVLNSDILFTDSLQTSNTS